MAGARSRSQAQKRNMLVAMGDKLTEPSAEETHVLPEQTLQELLDGFAPYLKGMIETLGIAAQPKQLGTAHGRPGTSTRPEKRPRVL